MSLLIELVLSRLHGVKQHPGYVMARCPAHDDRTASLSVKEGDNGRPLFYCFAGCGYEAIFTALGLEASGLTATYRQVEKPQVRKQFTPQECESVWRQARARAMDDEAIDRDRDVYRYLDERLLSEAWEARIYGIVAAGMILPAAIERWPSRGYRIVAPLYDLNGRIASIQARCIRPAPRKVLFPAGGRAKAVVFANQQAQSLLRGEDVASAAILFGEGLTDYLALSIGSPEPVVCAPGASNAASCVGHWVRGRRLLLALDCDPAGNEAAVRVAQLAYECGATAVDRVRWSSGCVDACDALKAVGVEAFSDLLLAQLSEVSARDY